jgi:hypothetical protein
MRKICCLLIILILAGSQVAWGAAIPNLVGTWQGEGSWISSGGNMEGGYDQVYSGDTLQIFKQVGPSFVGKFVKREGGAFPADYYISGTINQSGQIQIKGGAAFDNGGFTNFEITANLVLKKGVSQITGDWREISYVLATPPVTPQVSSFSGTIDFTKNPE